MVVVLVVVLGSGVWAKVEYGDGLSQVRVLSRAWELVLELAREVEEALYSCWLSESLLGCVGKEGGAYE